MILNLLLNSRHYKLHKTVYFKAFSEYKNQQRTNLVQDNWDIGACQLLWTINTHCLLKHSLCDLITKIGNKNGKDHLSPYQTICQFKFTNVMFRISKISSQFAMTRYSKELYFAVLSTQNTAYCKNFG